VYRPRSFTASPAAGRALVVVFAGRLAALGAGLAGAFFAAALDVGFAALTFFFATFFMRRTLHNARASVNVIAGCLACQLGVDGVVRPDGPV
jgi:hypothetical protein